jgi:hypothetical protein
MKINEIKIAEDAQRNEPLVDAQIVDPDPFSIFLNILSFLGSVASIAAYADYRQQRRRDQTQQEHKTLLEARDYIMTLEVDAMQMETSLQKLEFLLLEANTEHHRTPLSRMEFRFGTCKPVFTLPGYRKFDEILFELNRIVGKSIETTSLLIQRLYNTNAGLGDHIFAQLFELQNRLNQVLRREGTYEEGFRSYYEVIAITRNNLRALREEIGRAIDRFS